MPEQNTQEYRTTWTKSEVSWSQQPSVERWGNLEKTQRQLQRCEVCTLSNGIFADGSEGWVHNGTQVSDGPIPWQTINADGSCSSYRPQSSKQFDKEPDAISVECRAQESRGWNNALKPAYEPIILARKPLDHKLTIAENVLTHGVGGLNIGGCRVEGIPESPGSTPPTPMRSYHGFEQRSPYDASKGRWPANLIHDGSDEVVELFPESSKPCGSPKKAKSRGTGIVYNMNGPAGSNAAYVGDSGSAARFFYCAKASKKDRGEDNNHPTVKPIALMQYLCRLITPPDGVVLDPFMGSGSTLVAAQLEGFNSIGIDTEESYCEIARRRCEDNT